MTDTATITHPGLALKGTKVIAWGYHEPITYGGPDDDRSGFTTVEFSFGAAGPVLRAQPDKIAPADTPLPEANDSRISVEKRPLTEARAAGHYGRGSWKATVEGALYPVWENTKKEAVLAAQRRLAILDWQAAQTAREDTDEPGHDGATFSPALLDTIGAAR